MVKYSISSFGRIKTSKGIIHTPNPEPSGYVRVKINKKNYCMHRLVAIAFNLPRQEGQNYINHKDGNPSNNKRSNLEYVTHSENISHSYKTNTNRKSSATKQSKPVLGRQIGTEVWIKYPSMREAARNLNLHARDVSSVCNEKQKRTGNYEFKIDNNSTETEVLEGEEWREVQNSDTKVSSFGRIKTSRGITHTPNPEPSGYVHVRINKKNYYMHRLVAIAFNLPRQEGQNYINHKDGNPSNNKRSNLEYVTHSENMSHSFKTNTNRKSNATKRSKPVLGRKLSTEVWIKYPSLIEAARHLNLKTGNISPVCNGKQKRTGNYEFKYEKDSMEPEVLEGEEWRDVDLSIDLPILN